MNHETNALSLHPEVQTLRAKVALLREALAGMLIEAHDLAHTIKPNLLAIYQTKIGVWELKQFHLQLRAARLKRNAELIQEQLNRGQWPELATIESQLATEFRAWELKITQESKRVADAELRLQHLLSPEANRHLKQIYYSLVKLLHPDLNPDLTDNQKFLWLRVQEAYEACDLDELRALAVLAERPETSPVSGLNSLERLTHQQDALERQIQRVRTEIEEIERRPPLTLREQLFDHDWVASRVAGIQAGIEELRARCDGLTQHIHSLLIEIPHERFFGKN